jgi:polyisoprenoid-binding protein YceI
MKTMKFIASLAAVVLVAVLFVRCTEDAATPITNYSITGTVTYPSFNGTSTPAAGAVVYLVKDATEPTANYDVATITDGTGAYSFTELPSGAYFVFANYDTENTNNVGGRMVGIYFTGEGANVDIAGANATQNIALTSAGQANALSVNTYEGGSWLQDWNHSVVGFEFPYDEQNAPYTGRFKSKEIYVDFNPADLGNSKIEATIDLLTINTDSPGGRDPKYNADNTLWQDPDTQAYKLGCIAGSFGIPDPDASTRNATFTSSTIEAYGNGYLATGPMVFNGVTSDVQMFFQFIPGFDNADKGFRYSSFQGTFEFAALDVFGIESGHVGGAMVTVTSSFQVKKAL